MTTNLSTNIIANVKAHIGLGTTASTIVLYWIGVLTPYLAFFGLLLGILVSFRAYQNTKEQKRINRLTLEKLEHPKHKKHD